MPSPRPDIRFVWDDETVPLINEHFTNLQQIARMHSGLSKATIQELLRSSYNSKEALLDFLSEGMREGPSELEKRRKQVTLWLKLLQTPSKELEMTSSDKTPEHTVKEIMKMLAESLKTFKTMYY